MSANTDIEWTDATWNPIAGCSRVSEGCRNCYAEGMAARFSKPGQWGHGLAEMVDGKTPLGNCDLCFMKGAATIKGIMRLFPERARWWIDQERNAPALGTLTKPEMALFRADRPSYRQMLDFVRRQRDFEGGPSDDCLPCDCTD
jgi:hypothetical protein